MNDVFGPLNKRGAGVAAVRVRRRGQRAEKEVMAEVEVRIFDPHGVVEAERDGNDPPGERGQQVQAAAHHLTHDIERVATRHRRGIEHGDLQRVHVGRRRLLVEKTGVEPAEPLHLGTSHDPSPLRRAVGARLYGLSGARLRPGATVAGTARSTPLLS